MHRSPNVLPEVDQDGDECPEVEDGGYRQGRWGDVESQFGQQGGDDDQVARGGYGEELGEPLDESPDDGAEHGGTVMVTVTQS
jgi:hypothetical protein